MTTASAGTPRELGFWMCTALVIGNTIGIGIFMMPAALAPYGLNSLIGWLITVLGCVAVAWVFAGLARLFPQDDGPYAYTQRAFGGPTAFMVLWCYWVSIWVTNATIATGVVGYLTALFPVLGTNPLLPPITALCLVWTFVLVNLLGVRTVGWMQILTMILKLVPMGAVIVLGLWQFFTDPLAYTRHLPATPIEFGSIAGASTLALFAMLGIECATIPAGRVRNPERTIPRATIVGTLLTAFIYISVFVVPLLLIPQDELAKSNAPFADLLARFIGSGYGQILAMFVVISGLGALNGWTLMAGELTQTFARHGTLPQGLAAVNAHAAPTRALLLTGAAASFMLLMNYTESMAKGFAFLSVVVTAANLPLYLFCALAIIVLWRRGEIRRPGRSAVVLLFAAALATAFSIWLFIGVGIRSLLWAVALALVGVPVYWWMRRSRASAVGLRDGA
jgi:basic amino acid/polyamine antiporter, APA family